MINHLAYSPDLNPIENIFSLIKFNLSKKLTDRSVLTEDALWKLIEESADGISLETINKLIRSIPGRLKQVIKKQGDMIDY